MLDLDKSAWQHVKFGDVVENANAKSTTPESDGIDRVIAMEHLDPGELYIQRWGSLESGTTFSRRVSPGQTLFGKRRAYQRKVAYAEFDAICSGDILTFEAIPGKLLPDLLPFIVQSDPFFERAVGTSAGSLSPRTNWRDLAKFEFDLPPLDEQKRIADLLWAVERQERSLRDAQECVRAARAAWIEDQLTRRSWPQLPVKDILKSGPTNGISARANDEGRGVPTLSISAVRNGRLSAHGAVKYVEMDASAAARFEIERNDVFVVRGNGNRDLVAKCGIAQEGLPGGCIYPDLMIRLRFDESKILPFFAATQWNSAFMHGKLVVKAKSTNGTWKVNGKDVSTHSLAVPPLTKQRDFMRDLSTLEAALSALNIEDLKHGRLRSTLLSSIFGDA